jgi:hypothetical protein
MVPWSRTFSITKEVFLGHVLLKIPFYTIPVQDLKMESWQFHKEGNTIHILLQRDGDHCLATKMLEEKRKNYDQFLAYPGERWR